MEQKINNFLFKARNKLEEKACFWSTSKDKMHQKGKGRDHRKGKGATNLGDCVHGTKSQCVKGDSYPIKRPWSKGGGRVIIARDARLKTEVVERERRPRISGTTPSGKKDKLHASISKEGSDLMDRLVIAGTLLACANFNTSQDCRYGGKCIYLHQKNDDDRKNNSGVTAIKFHVSAMSALKQQRSEALQSTITENCLEVLSKYWPSHGKFIRKRER